MPTFGVTSSADSPVGTFPAMGGKSADVIVVDGNPLEEMDAISRVQMTYLAGKRMV